MKSLSLEMLRLTSDEVLERSQMKTIMGATDCSHTTTCGNGTQTSGSGPCPNANDASLECSGNGGAISCVATGCS
ncbi:hypothetical protein BC751_1358 [Cecembia calidifontis]|jgi:hypothetical protein|uniref:Natural product n=1 Tax=Cecembia calidifontis TaxID=1187080 RepID=A0A4Q7P6T6_9BACT|nr:hypothetical protein BC751_1358 [Cecembia calidifontis]